MREGGRGGRRPRPAAWVPLAALVFLVAINLRPSLTSIGPLLPAIGADMDLDEGGQGVLGSLPLLTFAACSAAVHLLARRVGADRAVFVALGVLAAGILVRSYGGPVGLWAGTVTIGCAIAVGNVLVPVLVRNDYPHRVARATAIYSACLTLAAGTASAAAVPLSGVVGWRGALAVWAVPAVVVAVLWTPRLRRTAPALPEVADDHAADQPAGERSVWRQTHAWLVTAYFGLQATYFYVMVTWLPTIDIAAGTSPGRAGWHLFVLQLAGIIGGLTIPRLMRRPDRLVTAAGVAAVPMLVGVLGLLLAPGWVVLWALVMGVGCGSSLVVALSLVSLRGGSEGRTTRLSGMAQSLGYLMAAAGPVAAGQLAAVTGGWVAPLLLIVAVAVALLAVAVLAGRVRH